MRTPASDTISNALETLRSWLANTEDAVHESRQNDAWEAIEHEMRNICPEMKKSDPEHRLDLIINFGHAMMERGYLRGVKHMTDMEQRSRNRNQSKK